MTSAVLTSRSGSNSSNNNNNNNNSDNNISPTAPSSLSTMANYSNDNEKQDKIKRQMGRTRSMLMISMVVVLALGAFFVTHLQTLSSTSTPSSPLSLDGSSGFSKLKPSQISMTQQQQQDISQQRLGAPNSISSLESKVEELDSKVRQRKATPNVLMEVDPIGLDLTKQLQDATRELLYARYGKHDKYRIQVDLQFSPTIPDYDTNGPDGSIMIELGPIELIPCSVFYFMELARTFVKGAFHRNANHVLQVQMKSNAITRSMPFQEYSPDFPHKKGTTGYAGRPSGPGWYVSILDNTANHGPGSQQKHNPHEADALFGRVVQGFDDVVPRIHSTPQMSWLDPKNQIVITKMTIRISDDMGATFTKWHG